MSDLIRRMDAVQACHVGPSDEWSKSTKDGYNQAATDCARNILRIPAVQPDAGWRPIETAPKDKLILGEDGGMIRLVMWEDGAWVQVGATIERGWFEPTRWANIEPPTAMKGDSNE